MNLLPSISQLEILVNKFEIHSSKTKTEPGETVPIIPQHLPNFERCSLKFG